MKKTILMLSLAAAFMISACQKEVKKDDLKDDNDKASYSIGVDIGKSFKQQDVEIDVDKFMQGIKDGMTKDSAYLLTQDEMIRSMQNLQQEMVNKQTLKKKESLDKNKKAAEEFMVNNAKDKDVKATKSGLQYKVLVSGNGASPDSNDMAVTHYAGTLADGTEFDNSYKRGEPLTIEVGGVIKGWTEALQMMKVGDKWRLFIPPHLGYGENGAGTIPPNSVLIFDVELLDVKKQK